jgi:hypothetical protein
MPRKQPCETPRRAEIPKRKGKNCSILTRGIQSADETEFIRAINQYRAENKHSFPSWTEVLAVVRSLGYVKPGEDPAAAEVGRLDLADMRAEFGRAIAAESKLQFEVDVARFASEEREKRIAAMRTARNRLVGIARDAVDLFDEIATKPSEIDYDHMLAIKRELEVGMAEAVQPAIGTSLT